MGLARSIVRVLVGLAMVGVGILHFVNPEPFVRIMPSALPEPLILVYVSGVFEIALGVALQIPRLRTIAGWGLIALYVAVFPANVNMAINGIQLNPAEPMPSWIAWARLPFQIVFIGLAYWVSRPDKKPSPTTKT